MEEEERFVTPPAPAEPAVEVPPEIPAEPPAAELPPAEPVIEVPPVVSAAEPPTTPPAPDVSDDDRLMAALAWVSLVVLQLPLVSLVLLLAEGNKNRPFQRYHAITSILFWGVAIVYEILAAIAYTILSIVSLGCLAICLWVIFFLPHLAALYYAFQAYSGKTTEIPALSEFARQQGWV
jgi:uncharacterized membrane protein